MKIVLTSLALALGLALANYWALWHLGGAPTCTSCAAVLLAGPFVLAVALASILPLLGASDAPAPAKPAAAVAAPRPSEPPENTALRLLASLQEDGRLVDFLTEEIAGYSDEQIGAATRGIHATCGKALRACVRLEPVLPGREDETVTVPAGFDPASIRLTGNVQGEPPFTGTLRHAGWRAAGVTIPARAGLDPKIIAPAEVEIA
jgi:Domain of unknown function (DUF2760)